MENEYLSVDCPAQEQLARFRSQTQKSMTTQTYRDDPNAESDNWDFEDNEW
jgi:hypothetical protein